MFSHLFGTVGGTVSNLPSRLHKRPENGIYYCRVAVPKDLHASIGKFVDTENLLRALKDGALNADGRFIGNKDMLFAGDGEWGCKSKNTLEKPYEPISAIHWKNGKLDLANSRLWLEPFNFEYYQDVRLLKSALEALSAEPKQTGGVNLPSQITKRKSKSNKGRLHAVPAKIAEVYQQFMSEKKREPNAIELWSYIEANYEYYGFDDYYQSYENTGKPAFVFTVKGEPKHISYKNLENCLSEMKSGKRLPTGKLVTD